MKSCLSLSLGILLVSSISAQQTRLPKEAAQRYAQVCVEQIGFPYSGPIATDVEAKKACAEQGEGGGAMVIPQKNFDTNSLKKLGKEVVPLGQLWLRKWTLVIGGKAIPKDMVNTVVINIDEKDRPMPLLTLAIRKGAKGLELLVYAKESKPLQVIPLQETDLIQELPLEIEWQRGENQADPLTLRILGKYQAVLQITRQGS